MRKLSAFSLLLVVSLPALTARLGACPAIWFDEGYKANAARTLAERGVFGTYTIAGYVPFDPGIAAGPIEIGAVALSFKLFGTSVATARLAIVPFALLALGGLYAIAADLYGAPAGLFAVLATLALPPIHGISFLMLGRQVLAEAPSFAMMMVGLWLWFRSWEHDSRPLRLLSGLALGCSLISKMQVSFGLVPAVAVVALGRVAARRTRLSRVLELAAVVVGVIGAWLVLGRLLTSASVRHENQRLLMDAIRSNLVTPSLGRYLSRGGVVALGLMGGAVLAGGVGLWRRCGSAARAQDEHWAEAMLILFVLNTALWFALLSNGWPRYIYAALIISQALLGRVAWEFLQTTGRAVGRRWPAALPYASPLGIVFLALVAVGVNLSPIVRCRGDTAAQATAGYIRNKIPRDAVIETWEWELDALSGHWQYHHPDQRYLFLAIRQHDHDGASFQLDYDPLQADPDYLVTGPFSNWTRIYDRAVSAPSFQQLAQFGRYRVYRRQR